VILPGQKLPLKMPRKYVQHVMPSFMIEQFLFTEAGGNIKAVTC